MFSVGAFEHGKDLLGREKIKILREKMVNRTRFLRSRRDGIPSTGGGTGLGRGSERVAQRRGLNFYLRILRGVQFSL